MAELSLGCATAPAQIIAMKRLFVATCLLLSASAWAEDATVDEAEMQAQFDAYAEQVQQQLNFQQGRVAIVGAQATTQLGDAYRYLNAADGRKVLEELWGNPPDSDVLGMIVPADVSLVSDEAWAVVLSYQDDGHVEDEDAAGIDYSELLADMQEQTADANSARQEAGYGTVDLLGWAEPPHYDAQDKKLYWAKELAFNGAAEHTLNYDVRVLGREGVLVMSAVASMHSLPVIRPAMQDLLARTEFDEGARYADFNPDSDRVAAYGVAALIAGGIASKTGLLAKIGILLLSLKKFAVLIVVAIAGLLSRVFKRKSGAEG